MIDRADRIGAGVLIAMLLFVPAASGQPLTHRTPNLEGTWITSPWNFHFQFNHRFRVFGEDADIGDIFDDAIIDNAPTFTLSLGLPSPFMAGVKYATAPAIRNGNRSNEWFPYVKAAPWRREAWSLSGLLGYNSQAESVDGAVSAQGRVGRIELLGAVRGFSDALHVGEAGLALEGGLGLRINEYLVLAGDVGSFVAGPDTTAAWSAGIQIGIPFTPHTLSVQVSNSAGTTLQEASFAGIEAGGGDLTWGFEFTVPFSGFARWGRIVGVDDESEDGDRARARAPGPGERVVEIEIREFEFEGDTVRVAAGTTVRWINRDPVAHTTAGDEGEWESPLLGPSETYTVRLDEPGVYDYLCTLHPFMRSVLVVEEPGDGDV